MARYTDLIVVGANILDEANFDADSFSDDFSNGLDIGPANTSASKWSDDALYSNLGLGFGDDYVGNFERQFYVSQARPSAHDGFYPHSIVNGNLVIEGRKLAGVNDFQFARLKDYHMIVVPGGGPGGLGGLDRAKLSYFDGSTAERTVNHGPFVVEGQQYDGVHNVFGEYNHEGDDSLLFFRYPMTWKSGMLHTHNRFGFNMDRKGRVQFRAKMAAGAELNDLNDIRLNHVTFPALWLLQKIFYNHGPNGDELTSNPGLTYMPFTPSGKLNEPDVMEFHGYNTNLIFHALHHHSQASGSPSPTVISESIENYLHESPLMAPELDVSNVMVDYTMDFTPEKIGFAVNGKYMFVIDTPAAFNEPLKIYETVSGYPGSTGEVVRNPDGTGKIIGQQTNGDGSGKFMEFALLINLAFNAKWPLETMLDQYQELIVNQGKSYKPFTNDRAQMEVEYVRCAPLLETQSTNISTFTGYDIIANRPNGGRILVPSGRAKVA